MGSKKHKEKDKEKRGKKRRRSKSRSRTPPVKTSSTGDSSLSIEETNKLRIKLGLKPLKIEQSSAQNKSSQNDESNEEANVDRIKAEREEEAEEFAKDKNKKDFVHVPAVNYAEVRTAEKIRDRITTQREKRRLEAKLLAVKSLGGSDSDEDAESWVEKSRKIAEDKTIAQKREKALAELDDEFGVGDLVEKEFRKAKNNAYNEKSLKGMEVMHDAGRFIEGETVIMTLDDKNVLDEKEDVLVNVNMIDDEKFEKNVHNKKLRPELHGYNVFDELGGFDEHGRPLDKKILSKYDEEISGVERKSFVIGKDNLMEQRNAKAREKMERANKVLESVNSSSLVVGSDFYTPDEMTTFKKPRKKIRKVRKTLRADDLLKGNSEAAAVSSSTGRDHGSRKPKETNEGIEGDNVKHVKMEIDVELEALPSGQEIDVGDIKVEDEADLDFQLALNKARKARQKEKVVKSSVEKVADLLRCEASDSNEGSGNITLHETAEFCRNLGDIPGLITEDLYGDEKMDFETEEEQNRRQEEEDDRGNWNEVEIDETPVDITRAAELEKVQILDDEPELSSGVAGALKLAMKKGYVQEAKRKAALPSKMKHLQAKNYSIEDKNYEDDRFYKRDVYAGPTSDFKEKEHYKPDFKLEYTDEEGRTIPAKEAFRLLSHKFHGKGSGKNKIDKKRRKMEQDKLMQQMNSSDTPLGTLELLLDKQKKSNTPYVVLSGNKTGQTSALTKISKR